MSTSINLAAAVRFASPRTRGGEIRRAILRRLLLGCVELSLVIAFAVHADSSSASHMERVPGGAFESVLPPAVGVKQVKVAAFRLDRVPVSNAEFADFVKSQPQWRRDRIAGVFTDGQYLRHWQSAVAPGATILRQPVTRVSWFAASAYCESRGARLPTWYEWEYAAAASESNADARNDDAWRQRVLQWYSTSGRGTLPDVGATPANLYGVRDIHGVIWEWVDDHSGMLVAGDSRQQGDPDTMRFCGSGAITMEQKENYATLMRIAMLSSLQANYTTATMGFRCAIDERTTP